MPGELNRVYMNRQHENAMTAPVTAVKSESADNKPLDEQLREKGLI